MPVSLTGPSGQPELNLLPGGEPIAADGALLGAIGVAGGNNGENLPIAHAGPAVLARSPVVG